MTPEVIEELVARLEDAATGVNALLPTVPRGGSVAAPPLLAGVRDELRHPWVTRGGVIDRESVQGGPLLVVQQLEDVELPLTVSAMGGDASVALAIRYAATGQTAAVAWNARKTLWCVLRLFAMWAGAAPSEPTTRNGVRIGRPTSATLGPLYREDGSDILVAPMLVVLPVFDPWVLGAS